MGKRSSATVVTLRDCMTSGKPTASPSITLDQPLVLTGVDAPWLWPGEGRLTILWAGPDDVPAVTLINCAEATLQRIDFRCVTPCHTAFYFQRRNGGTAARPATLPHLADVRIFGDKKLRWPVRFGFTGDDANNEHAQIERSSFYGYTEYAVDIEGKQSKGHQFLHCRTEGGRGAVRAPSSFLWQGGTVALSSHADFLLYGGGGDAVKLRDGRSESSRRLLMTSEPTTAGWKILVDGFEFAADQLAEDGDFIQMYSTGPLTVRDCQIGGGAVPRLPTIGVGSLAPAHVSVQDNFFDGFGAHTLCPVRTFDQGRVIVSWGLNHYRRGANDDPNCVTLGAWGLQAQGKKI